MIARDAMLDELRREQRSMLDEQKSLEHELRWLLHHTHLPRDVVAAPPAVGARAHGAQAARPPRPHELAALGVDERRPLDLLDTLDALRPMAALASDARRPLDVRHEASREPPKPAPSERAAATQVVLYGAHAVDAQIWALRACARFADHSNRTATLRALGAWARAAATLRECGALRRGALERCVSAGAERALSSAIRLWAHTVASELLRIASERALNAARAQAERAVESARAHADGQLAVASCEVRAALASAERQASGAHERARLAALAAAAHRSLADGARAALGAWRLASRSMVLGFALESDRRASADAAQRARAGALARVLGGAARARDAGALLAWRGAVRELRGIAALAASVRARRQRGALRAWARALARQLALARAAALRALGHRLALSAAVHSAAERAPDEPLDARGCVRAWRGATGALRAAAAGRQPPDVRLVLHARALVGDAAHALGALGGAVHDALGALADAAADARLESARARIELDDARRALARAAEVDGASRAQVERLADALGARRRADAFATRAAGLGGTQRHATDAAARAEPRAQGAELERAALHRQLHAARARAAALDTLRSASVGDAAALAASAERAPSLTLELMRAAAVLRRTLAVELAAAEAELELARRRPTAVRLALVAEQLAAEAARADAASSRAARLDEAVRKRDAQLTVAVLAAELARQQALAARKDGAAALERLAAEHKAERAVWHAKLGLLADGWGRAAVDL